MGDILVTLGKFVCLPSALSCALGRPCETDARLVEDFAALIDHKKGDVSVLALKEWDAKGKYGDIVKSVAEAAGVKESDVRIYRIESGGARVEYWVVALDRREGRVVGLKALAIES